MADVVDTLVGRTAELQAVEAVLAELDAGRPAQLLVEGDPGIGKTRLLSELAASAGLRDFTVLDGSASELERDLPFWLFVDALDEYVAGLDPQLVAGLPAHTLDELALVLPGLSAAGDGGPVLQDERYRAHRAVRSLLERLAVRKPAVLILDDVHWADAGSVELLSTLVRSPPAAPILLVIAARPRQLQGRLLAAIERADRHNGLVRLTLEGLSREASADLLGSDIDAARRDALYLETGGNPFYLQQLARAGRSAGAPPSAWAESALGEIGVPPAVIAALAEELSLLSADALVLLRGAAVAGDPFEADLAAAAADADPDQAVGEPLDGLLDVGLVRSTDVPRRFRFRHPLVRRAVYESAPAGWRLGAHDRVARALQARGARASARAHHVEFAAHHGDEDAVAVLTEAAAASVLRAPASAASWYSAALRILPDDAPPTRRVELLVARARALAAQGRLAESHEDLLKCLDLLPPEARTLRVQIATACAGVERLLGRHEEAHARLLDTLDALGEPDTADAAALMIELAIDALFRSEPEAVGDWSARARAIAQTLGDRPLIAAASAMLTLAHAVAGRIPEGQTAYEETSALVRSMPDDELATRVDAAAYLTSAATYLDRYDDAVAHAERALRLGRAAGRLHPTLLPALGAAHMLRGRLDAAARILDDGVEAARLAGVTQAVAWSLRNRALLAVLAGDRAGAVEMAEEALELTGRLDESVLSAWAAMAVARASVMADDPERAVGVLGQPDGERALEPIPGAWRAMGLEALATALAHLDRTDEAARVTAVARAHADALGLPMAIAWARRAAASVDLLAGAPEAAAAHALASADAAEEVGAVVEGALSRLLAGRALAAAGEDERAVIELERAATAFGACGALPHRHAAEQELRRLGRQVHRRTRSGDATADALGALTARELEIAELVVDRRTNSEIAGSLFLSTKTIESHLRNIFRKLGVSSRVELARVVERERRGR